MAKKLEKFIAKEDALEKLRNYAKGLAKDAETCENIKRKTALDKLAAVNTCIDILATSARTAVFDAAAAEYWLH